LSRKQVDRRCNNFFGANCYGDCPGYIADRVEVSNAAQGNSRADRCAPDARCFGTVLERPSHPSIDEFIQPELRLAGLRINPRTNAPGRSSYYTDIKLKKISNLDETDCRTMPASEISHGPPMAPDWPLPTRLPTVSNCGWPMSIRPKPNVSVSFI